MDVAFSDDQELLRKSAREFLIDQCPPDLARRVAEEGPTIAEASKLWSHMAGLGWMGLAIPEDEGGIGYTLVDRAILAEEMGRANLPLPWFTTLCLAAETIRAAATPEQRKDLLGKIASGQARATLALMEPGGAISPGAIAARAEVSGGKVKLSGTKTFVPDLQTADIVIVAARLEDQPALIALEVADLAEVTSEPTLDQTRPLSTIVLDGIEIPEDRILGGGPCGWAPIEQALDRAATILAAEMAGGSQHCLDLSIEYAKVRKQFGRPIGSFQGVSHRCSEMLLQIEGARSLTYYAAWCCDEDAANAPIAVSSAKAAASDTFRSCTAQAIQIHGGIGFTWEANLHLWYRRAFWSAAYLGDAVTHRERVASLLGL
jgi:alkylation response protein AidB-like acyl-CoA dehydrogenase